MRLYLALLSHSKVSGSNAPPLCVACLLYLPVPVWTLLRHFGFLPQSKHMDVMLIGGSKSTVGMNASVNASMCCSRLVTCAGCTLLLAP